MPACRYHPTTAHAALQPGQARRLTLRSGQAPRLVGKRAAPFSVPPREKEKTLEHVAMCSKKKEKDSERASMCNINERGGGGERGRVIEGGGEGKREGGRKRASEKEGGSEAKRGREEGSERTQVGGRERASRFVKEVRGWNAGENATPQV